MEKSYLWVWGAKHNTILANQHLSYLCRYVKTTENPKPVGTRIHIGTHWHRVFFLELIIIQKN